MHVVDVSQSLLQGGLSTADGDRRTTTTFELNANATNYQLRSRVTTQTHQVGSNMVLYGKSETTWDDSCRVALTDQVWVDEDNDNRAVTQRSYDMQTGNLLTVTNPRGKVTSYEYDARKLFVNAENNPFYVHNYEYEYEYGTGTKVITRGPNIALCVYYDVANCPSHALRRDQNKIRVDGIGRMIQRWESYTTNYNVWYDWFFELRSVELNSYVDAASGTTPSSVTHQAALKEVAGVTTYTQDKTELDGHGRTIKTTKYALGAAAADDVTRFRYSADGTLHEVILTNPAANDASTVTYTYGYDSLGRPTSIRRPDSATLANQSGVDMAYDGVTSTTTEWLAGAAGKEAGTRTTADSFGRMIQVEERTAAMPATWVSTEYSYGPDDQVRQITDPESNVTTLTHDFAGHRTAITRGTRTWEYLYDGNGNEVAEVTPCTPQATCRAAHTTTTSYDDLDRPTSKLIAPRTLTSADRTLFGATSEVFFWDYGSNMRGRLSQWFNNAPGSVEVNMEWFGHNPQGQQEFFFHRFQSAGYPQLYRRLLHTHYLGGRPSQTYYLGADGAQYSATQQYYDARGLPSQLTLTPDAGYNWQPVVVDTRNVVGLVTKRRSDLSAPTTFVESNWTYDALGRVLDQTVQKGPGPTPVARQELSYFGNDDVKTLRHYLGTDSRLFTYDYDFRHQLTGVATDTSSYFGAAYHYGDAGRLTGATHTRTITPTPSGSDLKPRDVNYVYGGTDPEQVTALTNVAGGGTFASYTYDDAGNQLTRSYPSTGESWDYLYDGKDQLRRATKKLNGVVQGSEEYWYDSNGQRSHVVKRDAAGAKTELVWFLDDSEAHYDAAGTLVRVYENISVGTPVARVDRTGDNAYHIEYQFHGLASNTIAAVAQDGTINASFSYAPFGEVLEATNAGGATQGTPVHKRRFNDKVEDDIGGLIYYGARYYDKTFIGWTQADPLYGFAPDSAHQRPRKASLYSFSLNNSLRYLDPDGREARHSVCGDCFKGQTKFGTGLEVDWDVVGEIAGAVMDAPLTFAQVVTGLMTLPNDSAKPAAPPAPSLDALPVFRINLAPSKATESASEMRARNRQETKAQKEAKTYKSENRRQTREGDVQDLIRKEESIKGAHPENRTKKTDQRIKDKMDEEASTPPDPDPTPDPDPDLDPDPVKE